MSETDDYIQREFERYHAKHPEVYSMLVRFARQAKRKGQKRFGIKALFERVRWWYYVERTAGDEFKLNNNFTSRYARLITTREPDLQGFFETRRLRTMGDQ